MLRPSTQTEFAAGFVRGVLSIGVGTILQIILGLAGLMVAVRFISSEEFGVFVLLQVIASFFIALGNLAVQDVSVTKFIVGADDEQKFVVASTALCFNFIIGVLISFVIVMCKPLMYCLLKSERLSELTVYIPVFFLLNSFNELLIYILQGFHQYKIIAVSQLVNGLVKFLLILILLAYLGMNVVGLIYAFYLSFLASIVTLYFGIPSRKRLMVSRRWFLEMVKFGFPLGLNRLLSFAFSRVDRLILGAMLSPVGVAYFEVASRIPENGYRLLQSFQSVFFPNMSELISRKNQIEAEKMLNNSLRIVTVISAMAALVILLFKEDVVSVLFSDKYLESASALWILTVALSMGSIEYILGGTLVALGKSDKPLKINLLSAMTNVAGNIIMIPIFGFVGAAYATLLARIVANPVYVLFVNKCGLQVNLRKYLTPIVILGACGSVYMVYGSIGVGFKISLILIFVALCLGLSVITWKDMTILLKGMKGMRRRS